MLKMISDGVLLDSDDVDATPPPGGLPSGLEWTRTTVEHVLERQAAIDSAWRDATVAAWRAQLAAWWTE
jgi:hypothetical protein